MLFALRDHMKKVQIASLTQLAREFSINTEALRPMLDIWVKRGVISIVSTAKSCSQPCHGCGEVTGTYYQYLN